jgi:hypothetical protein
MTMETLPGTNTSFGDANGYLTNWQNLQATYPSGAAGYGKANFHIWDWPVQGNVDNHELISGGSASSIAFHYQVKFSVPGSQAGSWDVRIAPDFGYGGGVFLDGNPVAYNPNDMWWGLSWGNSSQQFQFSSSIGAGDHVIDVYGQEGCCDGQTGGEFRVNGGDYQPFTVPEPTSLTLLGAGAVSILGCVWLRRKAIAS